MKYKLYRWYAWGFGNHWVLEAESENLEDLKKSAKRTMTYIITENGKVIQSHVSGGYRYGMAHPVIPEVYPNA